MTGRVVGHYRILDRIGAGGMGVVYGAEDQRLRRPVALKFLPAGFASDEKARERLFAEARAASALDHPNICTIHAIEESPEDGLFIVMPAYTGETLKARLERGPIAPAEALRIASQIAEGLSRAHAAGIIHRDVKPANVIVTADGVTKILDFGLAMDPDLTVEYGTTAAGTLAYMSPEQASGEPVDAATDLWSLGVMLYEMLAGVPPFAGDSAVAILAAVARGRPAPVTERNRSIPKHVAAIVTRALSPSRAARYARAEDMLADLRAAMHDSDSGTRSASRPVPSIAVLPFSDMSPAKDQDWFCEGIAEELINALTAIPNVRVAARTSSFQFKGQALDVRAIGEKLDTRAVLEGSVRKAGNRVRITAQLIEAASGYHLWSERYDRDMDDVFAVQDEIARAIVDKLRVRLSGAQEDAPLVRQHTARPAAYQKYLEGRYYWLRRHTGAFQKAIDRFSEAIAIDPDYALAHAGLADAYSILALYGFAAPAAVGPKAIASARRAIELDSGLAETHAALALAMWTTQAQWREAVAVYERALALNPQAHAVRGQYASLLWYVGRFEEGMREVQTALEAEPLSPVLAFYWVAGFYITRQYARGVSECERMLAVHSDLPLILMIQSACLAAVGRLDEALAAGNRMAAVSDGLAPLVSRAAILRRMGRLQEAEQAVLEVEQTALSRHVSPLALADLHAALGRRTQALIWLRRAWEAREGLLPRATVDESYDFVRADPEYIAVMTEAGLLETLTAADAMLGRQLV